ncbi:hypothetical protein ABZ154_12530 [Streptomyces sp. NPDC006261]|uniref:hypothetical protein n=1 Tax=Streptomyces sp. NPDC006261 TaxID=3156739 RepID=UPI0033A92382
MKKHLLWIFVVIAVTVGIGGVFLVQEDEATDAQLKSCREAILAVRNDPAGDELSEIHFFQPKECGEPITKEQYTSLVVETEPNTPYDNNPFNDDQPMEDDF